MKQYPKKHSHQDERFENRRQDRPRGRMDDNHKRFNNRGRDRGPYRGDRFPGREKSGGRFERVNHGDEPRRKEEAGMLIVGRTVEEATEDACRRFGVSRDQLKVRIMEAGSKGFLGLLGTKPASIRVQLISGAIQNYAESILSKILKEMGLPDKIQRKHDIDGNLILDIQGPSGGVLIGRHGQTLESLQYVVSKIMQRVTGDNKELVIIDVESYRERQNDKLRDLAKNLAMKAKETGEEVSLHPMNARDRRIVHMTLKDNHDVTTQSRGEGMRRRVVVIPKVMKEQEKKVESTEMVQSPTLDDPPNSFEPSEPDSPDSSEPNEPDSPETTDEDSLASEMPSVENKDELDDNIGNRL